MGLCANTILSANYDMPILTRQLWHANCDLHCAREQYSRHTYIYVVLV